MDQFAKELASIDWMPAPSLIHFLTIVWYVTFTPYSTDSILKNV